MRNSRELFGKSRPAGVSLMRRVAQLLLLACLTASLIAATPEEKAAAAATMLESFDAC